MSLCLQCKVLYWNKHWFISIIGDIINVSHGILHIYGYNTLKVTGIEYRVSSGKLELQTLNSPWYRPGLPRNQSHMSAGCNSGRTSHPGLNVYTDGQWKQQRDISTVPNIMEPHCHIFIPQAAICIDAFTAGSWYTTVDLPWWRSPSPVCS